MVAATVMAALLLAAPSAPPSLAGHYRLHVHDAGSELVLHPNGRFEYGLAYGALDEAATGRWRRVGNHILLTTAPKPVPAAFSAGRAAHSAEVPLALHVTWPNGRGIPGMDFRVDFDSGAPFIDYINNDEGWQLDRAETRSLSE